MKLTAQDKDDLKSLMNHKGYKVFERLYQDKKSKLLETFMTANLGDEKVRLDLNGAQNTINGMKIIIELPKKLTIETIKTIDKFRQSPK